MRMRKLIADDAFSFDKVAPHEKSDQAKIDGDQTARIEALERENAEIKLHLIGLIRFMVSRRMLDLNELLAYLDAFDRYDGKEDQGYDGPMDTVCRRDI